MGIIAHIMADKLRIGVRSHNSEGTARGFTLIELMLVIAIMAILAAIAVPLFSGFRERAQVAVAVAGIKVIEQSLTSYYIDKDDYPDNLARIGLDTMRDPWGNPYVYTKLFGMGKKVTGLARKDRFMVPINTNFDLCSMGPDDQSRLPLTAKASQDDIIRANDGGYIGRASGF